MEILLLSAMHPRCNGSSHDLLERVAEGAVAVETTLERQLLGGKFTPVGQRLFIEADKVADAKTVDVSVVGDALLGKVLAQISTVCTDGTCQLCQRKVVLQVQPLVFAMLL